MVVYGTKAININSVQSETTTCDNCNSKGTITIDIFRKHAHIFWIPVFPFGKVGESECSNCKNILEPKEMPEQLKREYDSIKSVSKGPVWQFAGLSLIAILFAFGYYSSGEHKKLELQYLKTPLAGDVYSYKGENGNFSTLKVVSVSSDTVFVSPNDYEIDKRSKTYTIDKPENYPELFYGISIDDINKRYASNEIYDIDRD